MKTLAVHLHLYYTEQLPNILKYLRSLEGVDYDLFVTMVKAAEGVEEQIKSFNNKAKIWVVENRGYDIGPFIDFIHKINLDDYKYILKLHTKGTRSNNYTLLNNNRLDNALWGKILWDSMLSSSSQIKNNIKVLDKNKTIGMIGSAYCHTNSYIDYQELLPQINEQLVKIGYSSIKQLSFIAGSIFICRAKLLQPLTKFKLDDFASTDGKIKEGTLAHVMERIFGTIVTLQNQQILPIKHNYYGCKFFFTSLKRFFFQKKTTKNGKKLIKIFKIPVYSRKERL